MVLSKLQRQFLIEKFGLENPNKSKKKTLSSYFKQLKGLSSKKKLKEKLIPADNVLLLP
jgi:hypothetical protein